MDIEISCLKNHKWQAEIFSDEKADYEELKNDIKERGVLTPIQISPPDKIGSIPPNTIIAGHRRVKACKELKISKIPAMVLNLKTENDINNQFLLDNILRKKLNKVELVKAYKFVLEVEKEKAKERQATLNRTKSASGKTSGSIMLGRGDARDLAAKKFGVSGKTMEYHKQAYEFLISEKDEQMLEDWRDGKLGTKFVLNIKSDVKHDEKKNKKTMSQEDISPSVTNKQQYDESSVQEQLQDQNAEQVYDGEEMKDVEVETDVNIKERILELDKGINEKPNIYKKYPNELKNLYNRIRTFLRREKFLKH